MSEIRGPLQEPFAVALGVEAAKGGRSVCFARLADIVGLLAKTEREGQLRERIRFLARTALLIVDEIGCLPVTRPSLTLRVEHALAELPMGPW